MKVVVYVEGASDQLVLETILRPLIERKLWEGVQIVFSHLSGKGKHGLLLKVPGRAANALINNPQLFVVALPDLYPPDVVVPHRTPQELNLGVRQRFDEILAAKNVKNVQPIRDRFKVFCFKYELEVLLLAAEKSLQSALGISSLKPSWKTPVEDQNHDNPPKRVVEALFQEHGKTYTTSQAPLILQNANYEDLAERCPQCFKPFVEFLDGLAA